MNLHRFVMTLCLVSFFSQLVCCDDSPVATTDSVSVSSEEEHAYSAYRLFGGCAKQPNTDEDIKGRATMQDASSILFKKSTPHQGYGIICDGHGLVDLKIDYDSGANAANCVRDHLACACSEGVFNEGDSPHEVFTNTFPQIVADLKWYIDGGTTASVACINDGIVTIAHVGDSRVLVVSRENILLGATHDHRAIDLKETLKDHPHFTIPCYECTKKRPHTECSYPYIYEKRTGKGLALSRSLGDVRFSEVVGSAPDIASYPVSNISFMIMASDGLWDIMSNEDAIAITTGILQLRSEEDLRAAAPALYDAIKTEVEWALQFGVDEEDIDSFEARRCEFAATVLCNIAREKYRASGFKADNTTVIVIQVQHTE